jgi:hypothetical protein
VGRPPDPEYHSYDDYVEQKLKLIEESHAVVRENLHAASTRQKRCYDGRVRFQTFHVGQWVWLYNPRRYVGRSPKMQRNYSGPFLVTKQLGPVLFVVQKVRRSKTIVIHADKLKPFLGDPPTSWLPSVQQAESVEVTAKLTETATPQQHPSYTARNSGMERETVCAERHDENVPEINDEAQGTRSNSPVHNQSQFAILTTEDAPSVGYNSNSSNDDGNLQPIYLPLQPRPKRNRQPPVRYRQ